MPDCSVNCKDNPDAVDKKEWKCIKCNRDLKEDFKRVMKIREQEAKDAVKNQRIKELQQMIHQIEHEDKPDKEVRVS